MRPNELEVFVSHFFSLNLSQHFRGVEANDHPIALNGVSELGIKGGRRELVKPDHLYEGVLRILEKLWVKPECVYQA